jgi:hypothetical protein
LTLLRKSAKGNATESPRQSVAGADVLAQPGGLGYDASGNLTANGSGTSYTYNQENFMIAASTTLGSPSYVVDAVGRRSQKTIGGTTTIYFYAGAELIAEKTGSDWKDYIFFAGQRIAEQTGSTSSTAERRRLENRSVRSERGATALEFSKFADRRQSPCLCEVRSDETGSYPALERTRQQESPCYNDGRRDFCWRCKTCRRGASGFSS